MRLLATTSVLAVALLVAGCSSTPSREPPASPTATEGVAIACGPLGPASCTQAVSVAVATLPSPHPSIAAVQIAAPSAQMTCPPSGGPAGAHVCGVVVTVRTTVGESTVGLVQSANGWIWSNLVR
jgi:hypothetical protein